jgi:aryl-alcohol dehydrogenase-like predicted oxidoreductase
MPAGSRLALFERFARYGSSQSTSATEAYKEIADNHGISLAQMSLAFVCQQPFVTSNLIGATNMQQLSENIEAVNVTLSEEVLAEIEAIHNRYPDPAP